MNEKMKIQTKVFLFSVLKKFMDAIDRSNRALQIDMKDPQAYVLSAYSEFQSEKYQEVISDIGKAIR